MADNRKYRYNEEFNDDFLTDIDDSVDDGIYFENPDDYDDDLDYSTSASKSSSKKSSSDDSSKSNASCKKGTKKLIVKEILSYIKILVIAAVIALIITKFVIINAQVPTGSMENTINVNDRLIGFRLAYIFSEPKRGDIIIFKFPDDEEQNFVKRVIGTPGDVVTISEGKVYVNGEELVEDYIKEAMIDDGTSQTYIVPKDSYFVLGDNRNSSKDSRFWETTSYVTKDEILAKVIFKYYDGENSKPTFSLFSNN